MPLLAGSYVVLAWLLASALSRGQGFWIFVAAVAAFGVASVAFRSGRRRVLYALCFAVLIASALGLAFETLLHVAPGLLSGHVADVTYTGYHWQNGGIYDLDDHMGPVMRPNVRREMYWAGHWWTHTANADGYRGPRVARADVVFLGDSMIYGHGVDDDQALSARFAARTGLVVANLGQQGTCLLQELMRLRRIGVPLRPRVVMACSHYTDVVEATQWYPPDELERYLASPLGAPYLPLARPEYRPRPWWHLSSFWSRRIALPMRCAGIAGAVAREWRRSRPAGAGGRLRWTLPTEADLAAPFGPSSPQPRYEDALGWRVQVRSLREIKRVSDEIGARLIVFDLGYPRAFSSATEAAAREIGVAYSPAGRIALDQALEGRAIYLADDGHWTPEGNEAMAEELARAIEP